MSNSPAVNSCLNCSSFNLRLQFYYISVAVTWYEVRGPQFLRCSHSPASSYQVWY